MTQTAFGLLLHFCRYVYLDIFIFEAIWIARKKLNAKQHQILSNNFTSWKAKYSRCWISEKTFTNSDALKIEKKGKKYLLQINTVIVAYGYCQSSTKKCVWVFENPERNYFCFFVSTVKTETNPCPWNGEITRMILCQLKTHWNNEFFRL